MENQIYKNVKNNAQHEKDVDLVVLLKVLLKKWWLILIAAMIVGAGSYTYAKVFIKPTYRASFTAFVNNRQSQNTERVTSADINASQQLVETYTRILTSNTVMMKTAEYLGEGYTYGSIQGKVSAQGQGDTEIISVYVVAKSREEAYKIASAIEAISPDCMADIIEGSSMKIVDTTQMPYGRYSPTYSRYGVMGAVIGGMIMAAILIIKYFANDTISDETELEERFSIPVVGVIPDMSRLASGHYGYGYYKKGGRYSRYGRYGKYGSYSRYGTYGQSKTSAAKDSDAAANIQEKA